MRAEAAQLSLWIPYVERGIGYISLPDGEKASKLPENWKSGSMDLVLYRLFQLSTKKGRAWNSVTDRNFKEEIILKYFPIVDELFLPILISFL